MTTINTSSLGVYTSPFTVSIRKDEAATAVADKTAATETDELAGKDSTQAANGAAPAGGAGGGAAADMNQESIDKIKEQIKATQKQLQQTQKQLSSVQNGSGTEEQKAQQAMAIQTQIMGLNSTLQALQGALLQLVTSGGVDTTA